MEIGDNFLTITSITIFYEVAVSERRGIWAPGFSNQFNGGSRTPNAGATESNARYLSRVVLNIMSHVIGV